MSFQFVWGIPPGPAFAVAPTAWDAGSVDVSAGAVTQLLTVTNTGTSTMTMGTVAVTGTGFTKGTDNVSGQTLAAGASATVLISFDPNVAGGVVGMVSFPSDAPTTPNTVILTGLGYSAGVEASWVTDLRAAFGGITTADTTMPVGTYSTAQVNSAIIAAGNGPSPANHKKLIVAPGSTVTATGDTGILISAKSNFTLEMTGVTINQQTTGASNFSSAFFLKDSSYIRIIGATVLGGALLTGTDGAYAEGNEKKNGFFIGAGCSYIEIDDASLDDMLGWPYLISGDAPPKVLSHHIWIHDGRKAVGGVSNFATVGGDYVLYEDNQHNEDATWAAMDFEPDAATGHCRHYLIQRNGWYRWGHRGPGHTDWFVGLGKGYTGPPYATMNDITIRDNIIYEIQPRGQGMVIDAIGLQPYSDVVITGNVQLVPCTAPGSPMAFANFGNLTVTGNTCETVGHVPLVGSDTNATGVHTLTPNSV